MRADDDAATAAADEMESRERYKRREKSKKQGTYDDLCSFVVSICLLLGSGIERQQRQI